MIVQKGVDLPNEGREGSSFHHALARLRPRLRARDVVACVQGDPFAHCPDLLEQLEEPTPGFRWLGDTLYQDGCDGNPHHPGLPLREKHEEWLDKPWPGAAEFSAGGQFAVTGALVRTRPARFYRLMRDRVSAEREGAWIMERLWGALFAP